MLSVLKCDCVDGTSVQLCIQPTNGVTYFRAVSSIASLPQHLKPYVPLFCSVATKWVPLTLLLKIFMLVYDSEIHCGLFLHSKICFSLFHNLQITKVMQQNISAGLLKFPQKLYLRCNSHFGRCCGNVKLMIFALFYLQFIELSY